MDIIVLHSQEPMPVTILDLVGELDGKSYQGLIDTAQREYDAGARDLVLDLSRITLNSSAGISALHTVAMMFRGQPAAERQEGWASFRAINNDRHNGTQQHVKLLNPTQDVTRVLDRVGFNAIFDTFTDVQQAISSFH